MKSAVKTVHSHILYMKYYKNVLFGLFIAKIQETLITSN